MKISDIKAELQEKYSAQPTFLQAAEEFINSIEDYLTEITATEDDYRLVARMFIPEQVHSWRVDWVDDAGVVQTNTGYRVQYNSVLGPYKGGLRFDPSVNEDVLKFLGFEQIFKNSLTGLRLGAGKGGSDFSPKGKSDNEVRAFAHAFMLGLHKHIGIEVDVPAGDIGVGGREVGYLYGAYKKITGNNDGVLTGKDELFGGSCRRTEATGHGAVYFAEAMAEHHNIKLKGLTVAISGSGNVAEYTARKLTELGAIVVTLSDRVGYLYKPNGFNSSDFVTIALAKKAHKNLSEVSLEDVEYREGKPWQSVAVDMYFPCATQNEVSVDDAAVMVKTARMIVEGANMPLTLEAVGVVQNAGIPYAPGKAANAGGVSVSGIEMAQNAGHYSWSCDDVEAELKRIMNHIHRQCVAYGTSDKGVDYVKGANIAGFKRVFEATKKLGW